jgi:hypothetical protein
MDVVCERTQWAEQFPFPIEQVVAVAARLQAPVAPATKLVI